MNDVSTHVQLSARPMLLLAEDNGLLRKILADYLRRSGFDVLEAIDGTALHEVLLDVENGPNLVISDVEMPGQSGLAVLAGLRGRGSVLPFLLMTGRVSDAVREHANGLGAPVLEKPFRFDVLRNLVFALLHPGPVELAG